METVVSVAIGWTAIAFALALGFFFGAKIHGTNAYDAGFANGREYQKLVEKGVIKE